MTLRRLWAFLAVGLPVLGTLIANLSAVDLADHLRAGELLLATGRIPTTDTFTFTAAGATWLNQQWGAQAILAAVLGSAGGAGSSCSGHSWSGSPSGACSPPAAASASTSGDRPGSPSPPS